jgi:hypothetical protein
MTHIMNNKEKLYKYIIIILRMFITISQLEVNIFTQTQNLLFN